MTERHNDLATESVVPTSADDDRAKARQSASGRANWLRAGVLGANDGIVSIAGLVIGVAAATDSRTAVFAAGGAGLIAGAFSMALGEYVSVSTQRDNERALLARERDELATDPDAELAELIAIYESKGLTSDTARTVAEELTEHDAFAAHVDAELGIDPDALTTPWHAALSSAISFVLGALLPLVAILLPPAAERLPVAVIAVFVALALTGAISAKLSGAPAAKSIARVLAGGGAAMALTFAIGSAVGTSAL